MFATREALVSEMYFLSMRCNNIRDNFTVLYVNNVFCNHLGVICHYFKNIKFIVASSNDIPVPKKPQSIVYKTATINNLQSYNANLDHRIFLYKGDNVEQFYDSCRYIMHYVGCNEDYNVALQLQDKMLATTDKEFLLTRKECIGQQIPVAWRNDGMVRCCYKRNRSITLCSIPIQEMYDNQYFDKVEGFDMCRDCYVESFMLDLYCKKFGYDILDVWLSQVARILDCNLLTDDHGKCF